MSTVSFPTTDDLLADLAARLPALPEGAITDVFGGLPRHLGKAPLVEPTDDGRFLRSPEFVMDLAAFAAFQLGAMALARRSSPDILRQLFDHGDLDERSAVMRCLLVVPTNHPVVHDLLGEAQRANALDIYEAAWCDHDLAIRALSPDDFNRMVLKLAFSNLPLWRVLGAEHGANSELSRMLEDFALEREAAGRPIWPDTLTLQALSPVDATPERLRRYAEHDDPELSSRARRGLAQLA